MGSNQSRQHCLIFDPIQFSGGSKIATKEILRLCPPLRTRFTIVTNDTASWTSGKNENEDNFEFVAIPNFLLVKNGEHGVRFWICQLIFSLFTLWVMARKGAVDTFIGASGPGIDMPIYIITRLFHANIVQLVHGPVGQSRSIGYCLTQANSVFYLESTKQSIELALSCYTDQHLSVSESKTITYAFFKQAHVQPFVNGISRVNWPSRCNQQFPIVFWCASILKWKGLDLLLEAANLSESNHPFGANICYIRPKNTALEVSVAPQNMPHFHWFESPNNLDDIRKLSSIFVSTSTQEPFGLSILEALAAGMCVLIPSDGAYWDTVLEHNINCIKYSPNSALALAVAIECVADDDSLRHRISANAVNTAEIYRAEACYWGIVNHITTNHSVTTSHKGRHLNSSH